MSGPETRSENSRDKNSKETESNWDDSNRSRPSVTMVRFKTRDAIMGSLPSECCPDPWSLPRAIETVFLSLSACKCRFWKLYPQSHQMVTIFSHFQHEMVLNFNMQPNYDCKHFVKQTNFKPFFKKQFFSGHFVLHKSLKNKTVWGTRESKVEKKRRHKMKWL